MVQARARDTRMRYATAMASIEERACKQQQEIAAEIARLGLCPPGTLVERSTRCGTQTCHCHEDPKHLRGPYPSWIRKDGSRTATRTLSHEQLERYEPLFDNTRRLRELINELEALAIEVLDHADRDEHRQRRPGQSRR
jgi:hypothetical protein